MVMNTDTTMSNTANIISNIGMQTPPNHSSTMECPPAPKRSNKDRIYRTIKPVRLIDRLRNTDTENQPVISMNSIYKLF